MSKPLNLMKFAVNVCCDKYFLDLLFIYEVNKPPKGIMAKKTKVAIAIKKPTMETMWAVLETEDKPA